MNRSITAGALLLVAASAHANDTTAELTTGGLVYARTADITMAEENLYISRQEVLVDYVFQNTADKDVESVVAFPMPDVVGGSESDISMGDPEADNFLGFSVLQDGRQIKPELQQRVIVAGIDRTDEFLALKIPLLPYSDKTLQALKALPADVQADLIAKGAVYLDRYDAGKGWQEDLRPLWTLRSAYWWKTKFPKGKPVKVSHRYKPSVGGTVGITFANPSEPGGTYKNYVEKYCVDDAFLKVANRLEAAAAKSGPHYTEQWLSYILTTGANWGGAIGKFRLTVDKGNEKDYVSFCGKGVKKIGPTTFEMTATDFVPEKELHVLFLTTTAE